jgi:single-stranded-DNA-specific exonuclease
MAPLDLRRQGLLGMPHRTIVRRSLPETPDDLPDALHPVVRRVLLARQVTSAADLSRSAADLHGYEALLDIDKAAELLGRAVERGSRILIVGDFDADGATASAVAVRALRLMGVRQVDYLVPSRFRFGYGLSTELVRVAAQRRPDLIVTVDNGIASLEGVAEAKRLGIQVIVTDHHLPGAELPAADAIVNPNRPGDLFPSKQLAGVGVIFYVMLALRVHLRARGWFDGRRLPEPNLAQLLDLVALGTVADLVPLDRNNRILVAQGVARIRAGTCCPGVRALAQVAGRALSRLTAQDLGFGLAPRLNAAGRLEEMSLGIACLLEDDPAQAEERARTLDGLNRDRRAIEEDMHQRALEVLASQLDARTVLPHGLCLYDDQWHQGVVGILASRIREQLHRPVIAFAPGDAGEIKGSARSVPGLHMRDALAAIASRQPDLMRKFGGHAMAAGLSLSDDRFGAFAQAFDDEVKQRLGLAQPVGVVHSDGELAPEQISIELAQALRAAGPWGQGFPEPVFDGLFEVADSRTVGERHQRLVVRQAGDRRTQVALAFRTEPGPWMERGSGLRLAYRLDLDHYQGRVSPRLVVEHLEPVVRGSAESDPKQAGTP